MDRFRTAFAVLVAILLIVALSSVTAGDGEPAGIRETLAFISVAGAAFGAVISQALEDADWFQNLSSFWREVVVKIITGVLPLGAFILLEFLPVEIPAPINQIWVWSVLALITFAAGQVYHVSVNRGRTYT